MRGILFAAAFAFTAATVTAEEPKPDEIKKQIAETEAAIAKKKAELAKAQAALKAAEAEADQVLALGPDRLKEAENIAKLMTEKPKQKAAETQRTAEKASKALDEAARVAVEVSKKLTDSTDPKETEELKKKLAEAEAKVKEKFAEAMKAQTAAVDAAKVLEKALKEAFEQMKAVVILQGKAEIDALNNALIAEKGVLKTQGELALAEATLLKLKEQIKTIEK